MKNPALPDRQKEQISDWFTANRKVISESDSRYLNFPLFTDARLQQLTFLECSHRTKDWKDLITDCWLNP